MRLETLAVHAGAERDAATGALAPPLHLSTTFEHAPDGTMPHGLLYQRYDNPTQQRTEAAVGALEGGAAGVLYATGMAAACAVLQSLPAGSEVLLGDDLYHGVRALAERWCAQWRIGWRVVDLSDLDGVRAALSPSTRLIWAESPSNPLLKIADIAALADIAHAGGARLLVDNTFATPLLQRPLALGADLVLHSATKYFGGHSDVMGGVLVCAREDEATDTLREVRRLQGNSASPFAAWLILRGLRSLPARMAWQCRSAQRIAEWLAAQPRVAIVHYPGLPSHPQHALAACQMRDGGAMLSIEIAGGREAALAVAGRLRLFTNATSLGGCESLIEHRASIEGAHPTSPPGLLRLSIGLEDPDDLIDDLRAALG